MKEKLVDILNEMADFFSVSQIKSCISHYVPLMLRSDKITAKRGG